MEAFWHGSATGRRFWSSLIIAVLPILTGASHSTPNFQVEAPNAEAARQVGEHAEACRKSIAREWLGQELPNWDARCPIRVRLTGGDAGGLTSFGFDRGRVTDQNIKLEGRLDRILASSLPHEITHTIFAAYFGGPMPRWADEGASLLSEDEHEKQRHDRIVASLLARRSDLHLSRLFRLEEYPSDLMGFYGQGYSVSRFLVEMGGRSRFLNFVRDGARSGWDDAARSHYSMADCQELDRAWRAWHKVLALNVEGHAPSLASRTTRGKDGVSPASVGGTMGRETSVASLVGFGKPSQPVAPVP